LPLLFAPSRRQHGMVQRRDKARRGTAIALR
jgi:hypothetical protein